MSRWVYPILGLIVNTMLGGLYAFSLYYPALQKIYGLEVIAPLALAFSLATLFFAVSMPFGGVVYDKVGPRIPVIIGAILILIGYLLGWSMRFIPTWGTAMIPYYIGLGVLAGLGIGFAYAVPGPLAAKWFPDRTGAAVGTAVLGFGIGAAVSTPLIRYFISAVGVFNTFLYMGVIYCGVMLVAGLIMKNPPPDFKPPKMPPAAAPAVGVTLREAIRDKRFYFLWLAYVFSAFAGLMVIGNAAPILKEGLGKGGVALGTIAALIPTFIIVTSFFNAGGRPSWGTILDRIGPWKGMMLNHALTAIILILVSFGYVNIIAAFALFSIVYFNYGGILALYPSATAILFGRKFLGRIYGVIFSAWGVAGLSGALIGALIRDITGSYFAAFYVAMILSLIATAMAFIGLKITPVAPKS